MNRIKNKEKLYIAMLGQKHIPSSEGGIEVVVEELAVRMVQMGHRVTCFNRKGHNVAGARFDGPKLASYKGIAVKEVPTISRRGFAAISSAFFATILASIGKYDVVHIHAEGTAFMCWLPKMFGKRVIVTVHGLDHRRAKWGRIATAVILLGEKTAVRFADEIIVLSSGVQTYFMDTYGRKTCFIPNGVKKAEIGPVDRIRKEWGLEKDGYILYLGRIVPEKGIQYLIEAFHRVHTGKRLVIAGGSSDTDAFMEQLKAMARGDRRILFTDFVQGPVKQELYTNAYFYVLPTDLEGMSLGLLEAMSYGNCCLISDIPECSEVVGEKAVQFRRGDVENLREKMQWLCDQPETVRKYKEMAAGFTETKYNWDDVVRETIDIYKGSLS